MTDKQIDEKKVGKIKRFIKKNNVIIDKIGATIAIITFAIVTALILSSFINSCTDNKPIKVPTEKTINETCTEHGMKPLGYTTDFDEGTSSVTCKIIYYNKTKQKVTLNLTNTTHLELNETEYLESLNGTCKRASDCFIQHNLTGCRRQICNWCCDTKETLAGCTLLYCMEE